MIVNKVTNAKTVLVTGGAGYIGSHVVRQLGDAGYRIVIYDSLITGSSTSILYGEHIIGDLADIEKLYRVFAKYKFDAVLHFAASLVAPESVANPLEYYANNTRNTLNLLRCCETMGVDRFIFSSTAAVYGEPEHNPVLEESPTQPINPYGRSKLMSEWITQDFAAISNFRYVILRYFNVAGASPDGRLGQTTENATQLIRVACDAALGRRPGLNIFGTDFATPDGTAIRDYIHVEDLASAHVAALQYLESDGESQVVNCGYGKGYSVREVADRVKAISQVNFPVLEVDRRPGDPACVLASVDKIRALLHWQPKYDNLDLIIQHALNWENQRSLKSEISYSSPNRDSLIPTSPRRLNQFIAN
jgi:UDP-glucose 4-epimerase